MTTEPGQASTLRARARLLRTLAVELERTPAMALERFAGRRHVAQPAGRRVRARVGRRPDADLPRRRRPAVDGAAASSDAPPTSSANWRGSRPSRRRERVRVRPGARRDAAPPHPRGARRARRDPIRRSRRRRRHACRRPDARHARTRLDAVHRRDPHEHRDDGLAPRARRRSHLALGPRRRTGRPWLAGHVVDRHQRSRRPDATPRSIDRLHDTIERFRAAVVGGGDVDHAERQLATFADEAVRRARHDRAGFAAVMDGTSRRSWRHRDPRRDRCPRRFGSDVTPAVTASHRPRSISPSSWPRSAPRRPVPELIGAHLRASTSLAPLDRRSRPGAWDPDRPRRVDEPD